MKTNIFKYAHTIARNWNTYKMRKKYNNFELSYSDLFSIALKVAYKKASTPKKETVKLLAEFVSETSKAVCLSIVMANRSEKIQWFPKSLINVNTFEVQTWFLRKNNLHIQRL